MKVSIITPTYNWEKYIAKTIESVLQQKFQDYEYIIIDDCSKDSTLEILEKYKNNKHIKLLKNTTNLWIVWSRNKGLEIAQWEYLCFLDHDDIRSSPMKLEKQVDFLDKNTDYWIIGTQCEFINEKGEVTWALSYKTTDWDIRNKLLQWNQFCTCSVMFRKSLLIKTGLLREKYNKVDDYDLWLRIGNYSKMTNLDFPFVQYRKYWNNTSRQNLNFFKMKWLHIKLILENIKKYPNGIFALFFWLTNLLIPYGVAEKFRPLWKKLFW